MSVVRRRLAEIVETRPDEFPQRPTVVFLHRPVVVRQIRPEAAFDVVSAALPVGVDRAFRLDNRELVRGPARDGRGGLDSEHHAVAGRGIANCAVERQAVGDGGHVHLRHDSVLYRLRHRGHSGRDGARPVRVERMYVVLHRPVHRRPFLNALLRNLVADRPHHDARMVAPEADELPKILFPPIVVEKVVSVRALRHTPAVERLRHHHHPHFVADFKNATRGSVVRRAYRIASHLL